MNQRFWRRLGAACGVFSVVLEIVGLAVAVVSSPKLVDATLGSSEGEISRAFASPATTGVWVGLCLEVIAFLLFVVFAARLWDALRCAEGGTGWISPPPLAPVYYSPASRSWRSRSGGCRITRQVRE